MVANSPLAQCASALRTEINKQAIHAAPNKQPHTKLTAVNGNVAYAGLCKLLRAVAITCWRSLTQGVLGAPLAH
jgi:hypothetical protein